MSIEHLLIVSGAGIAVALLILTRQTKVPPVVPKLDRKDGTSPMMDTLNRRVRDGDDFSSR